MPKIWRKLTLRPNLCCSATSEKNCLREEDRLGDFTRREKSPKTFFERRSQDCGIISEQIQNIEDFRKFPGGLFPPLNL